MNLEERIRRLELMVFGDGGGIVYTKQEATNLVELERQNKSIGFYEPLKEAQNDGGTDASPDGGSEQPG